MPAVAEAGTAATVATVSRVASIPGRTWAEIAKAAIDFVGDYVNSPHPTVPPRVDPQGHVEEAGRASARGKIPTRNKILGFFLFLIPFLPVDDENTCP